jgi:MFS family permease
MLAKQLAPFLLRRGIHYGWVMVAITFIVALASAGALGILGALLPPLQRDTGWDNGSISGALALRLLLYGLMAPFAAALLARYGLRRIVGLGMALGIAGCLLSMVSTQVWQLWASWGVLVGVGMGLTALVLGATVANRWFVARRGLVVGALTAAGASGQIIFLPLASWLAQHEGWRFAMVPGLGVCLAAGVLFVLLGCNHPAELGMKAYGEEGPGAPLPPPAPNAVRNAFAMLAEASHSAAFWILFITFFVCGLSTAGLIQTHFIPLCADYGMAEVEAAGVLAMMGGFNFVGTIASGWLSDRYDCRKLLFWYYGLRGLSLLFLPSSDFSFYGLSIFAVFYGLDWIATVPPTVKLAAQSFGRDKAPLVFGWVFVGHQLGSAAAAFGGGVTRDALASYLPAFYTAGAACIVAAVLVLAIARKPTAPVAA